MAEAPRALRVLAAAVALAASGAPALAHAQPTPSSTGQVTAEALFVEGRRLVAAGQFADACPKFADSQRLDPSPATLLNLASCYERLGRTATAWATYREAASAANAAGRNDFVAAAQRHADALVPHLSRMTLSVAQPLDGIEVKRDGLLVDRAEWGTPIPLDPGPHTLVAVAPGHKPWAATVDVPHDAAQVTSIVPPLEPLPPPRDEAVAPSPALSAALASPAPAPVAVVPEAHHDSGAGARVAGWIVGGAGVVSVAIGAGFAVAAKDRYNDSLSHCEHAPNNNLCDPTGVSERDDARTRGDVASWTIGVGAAVAVAGIAIVLVAPHDGKGERTASSWVLMPTLGGATVEGTW
jgi:hypothetical protein